MKPFYCCFALLLCFCGTIKAQSPNCYHYHNGKFKIIDSVHNSYILIDRKDSLEIEYIYKNVDTSQYYMKLTFKVEWINDCTYKQYLTENAIHTNKGDKFLPIGNRVFSNRIMETYPDSYIVYTQMNDRAGTKYANRIWLVK